MRIEKKGPMSLVVAMVNVNGMWMDLSEPQQESQRHQRSANLSVNNGANKKLINW